MYKFLLSFLFVLLSAISSAQKVFFIYLQSESEQPFFVRLNEKIHSSSSSGYLILPKLVDSTYTFLLGFPQQKWPEQKFSITLNRKDHGYLVKNFGDKGWGLFDLQSLAVQMSSIATAKLEEPAKQENKNVSAFTDILSKASDDPSLKERTAGPVVDEKKATTIDRPEVKSEPKTEVKKDVVKEQFKIVETTPAPAEKKQEEKKESKETPPVKQSEIVITPEEKKDTNVNKPLENTLSGEPKAETPINRSIQKEQTNILQEEYIRSTVSKRSESSTTEGFGLTFLDDYNNGLRDTITILIPNPKPAVVPVQDKPREERKFLEVQSLPAKEDPKPVVNTVPGTAETKTIITQKSKCNEVAIETDFLMLRKKMAAAESDDEMINEAKKQFKTKCFTTTQIKNLSTLFLNDESKYHFFDAAYNYTNDKEYFSVLQGELKDEYYLNRFKAMLRN